MATMNRGKEKEPSTAETSFIEGSPLSRVLTSNAKAWETLTGIFPEAKATELEATYSKTGKLHVKMFGQGKRAYPLFTKDKDTGGQRLNPILPRQIKSALGTALTDGEVSDAEFNLILREIENYYSLKGQLRREVRIENKSSSEKVDVEAIKKEIKNEYKKNLGSLIDINA